MKICVAGACGRMGRRILELAAQEGIEVAGAVEAPNFVGTELVFGNECNRPQRILVTGDPVAALERADVLIYFSVPKASIQNACAAYQQRKPAVIGTTGFTPEQREEINGFAKEIPIVLAPNMSVGMNLLFRLVAEAAKVLGTTYNVEIVEVHHNQKKDSPSGSAIRLAQSAAASLGLQYPEHVVYGREGLVGPRPTEELGIHAVRGGDVTGDHTVFFLGKGERLELTHRAHSRDTFAAGALRAAKFVLTAPPGLYDMQDVLSLK